MVFPSVPSRNNAASWQSKAGEVYDIHAIPDNILIDPNGIIVARDLRGPELERRLSEIFK